MTETVGAAASLTPLGFAVVMTATFLFGTVVGSFANVVIARVPRGESIVHPGSHCPHCEAPVRPYDNIPVFSWLALRGRCRDCGWSIPVRYPLVELAAGFVALAATASVLVLLGR